MADERKELDEEELNQVDGGHSFTPIHLEKGTPNLIMEAVRRVMQAVEEADPSQNPDKAEIGKIDSDEQTAQGKKRENSEPFHSNLV